MRQVVACLALIAVTRILPLGQARAEDLIHVDVVGLHNDVGQVGCNIYSSAAGFPTDPSKALHGVLTPIKDKKATCDFKELPAGRYAIAVMHDENSNGKVDTNFMGIPKEGVGASNDAKGMMGPPKFDDAAFDYAGGRKDLTIHITY
jgi:uncharacterized protein (DUF2141 family)